MVTNNINLCKDEGFNCKFLLKDDETGEEYCDLTEMCPFIPLFLKIDDLRKKKPDYKKTAEHFAKIRNNLNDEIKVLKEKIVKLQDTEPRKVILEYMEDNIKLKEELRQLKTSRGVVTATLSEEQMDNVKLGNLLTEARKILESYHNLINPSQPYFKRRAAEWLEKFKKESPIQEWKEINKEMLDSWFSAFFVAVLGEYHSATTKFGPFHTAHEGYAIILEEVEELWEEIKEKIPNQNKLLYEAIQVCAMAMRFVKDICDREFKRLFVGVE